MCLVGSEGDPYFLSSLRDCESGINCQRGGGKGDRRNWSSLLALDAEKQVGRKEAALGGEDAPGEYASLLIATCSHA